MTKNEIRKSLIKKRDLLEPSFKSCLDKAISDCIINSVQFKNARQALLFAPTGSEFNTEHIAREAVKSGKRLYYPRCADKDGKMDFFLVSDESDFRIGMYGIREPREGCPEYSEKDGDIIIVPALSVDKSFIRIGYGKGYYDRFLKNFHGVSVCPCYEEMRTDRLPADEFDICVDIVATQNGLYKRRVSYE